MFLRMRSMKGSCEKSKALWLSRPSLTKKHEKVCASGLPFVTILLILRYKAALRTRCRYIFFRILRALEWVLHRDARTQSSDHLLRDARTQTSFLIMEGKEEHFASNILDFSMLLSLRFPSWVTTTFGIQLSIPRTSRKGRTQTYSEAKIRSSLMPGALRYASQVRSSRSAL